MNRDEVIRQEIQATRQALALTRKMAGGGYDNPWEGPDAEELSQDCPYCDAPGFDMHQVDCPSLYTDTPGIDKKLLGPNKWEVPFAEHPSFRLNSVVAFADHVLASLQQRPRRPGEVPRDSWELWERPTGIGDDFDLFEGLGEHEEDRR